QHQAALVSLQGQAVDLTTPALQSGPDLGGERRRAGGFQGLQHLLEGEPCASRPPEGGRGEAIHPLACRGTDPGGKAGEGRFESCHVLVWTRHDRERAVILDGECTRVHGELPTEGLERRFQQASYQISARQNTQSVFENSSCTSVTA